MVKDAFGEPLEVGDYVGCGPTERGTVSVKGRIVDFSEKRILIVVTDVDTSGKRGSWWSSEVGEEKWVFPHLVTRTLRSFERIDKTKEREKRIESGYEL